MMGLVILSEPVPDRDPLADAGRLTVVRGHCREAERLDPKEALAQVCFARLAAAEERWAAARDFFVRALDLGVTRRDRILAALAQVRLDLLAVQEGTGVFEDWNLIRGDLARHVASYPYSPDLRAASGLLHHKMGLPERAARDYLRAQDLRPERWETAAARVELALDLGDIGGARRLWAQARERLAEAPEAARKSLAERLRQAERFFQRSTRKAHGDPDVP
jgi:tetratricopeptide (TPR) repeat protein